MSQILDFDVEVLDKLIKRFGLKKAWINILATHIQGNKKLTYILESTEFLGHSILKEDLIDGLSIGEIGVLYEYSLTSKDSKSRKNNGQYFTPDDVAKFMVQLSADFPRGVWLDPCSGIGNLSWHLANSQDSPEQFLLSNLILSDKDPLALLIARVLFSISFQNKVSDLFESSKDRFIEFDFLSVSKGGQLDLFRKESSLKLLPNHDFVIVNPPYLATVEDSRFDTAKCRDLYGYFLENIIHTSGGFISITPQSFTNSTKFQSLRKLMIERYGKLTIYAFDNVPANIFKGIKFGSQNTNQANSTRAAITVALEGKKSHKITSLIRWTSDQRSILFQSASKNLSTLDFDSDFFPKVGKNFLPLYKETKKSSRLSELMSKNETNFALYIPSSPRYFIPALKKPVHRSSLRTLYFPNVDSQNRAYLLINSSLMYWWWRVRDGGMTLSLETLRSLPMPKFDLDVTLIKKLESSEVKNRVYKMNAGSEQENVKHPESLLRLVNEAVCPEYAELLIKLHENSDIGNFV